MILRTWPQTVFDTADWLRAWSTATIERVTARDDTAPGFYAVEWSPFWQGYAVDAGMPLLWDRPLLTVSSLYSFYGPSYLLEEAGAVERVVERARDLTHEWNTAGMLVANLPREAALAWSKQCPPDAAVRLDVAYHRLVGVGADPVVGDVAKRVRTDWRRRWRRATEQGLRLIDDVHPSPARTAQVIALANASATRHGWPTVYDQTTAEAVLSIPGARLLRAEWFGQIVAAFIAFEHEQTLYLWAGGTHETLLHEVSPYLFVLYEILATGVERGWRRIEFGRGNDSFKRKYGFEGTETWSLWYARNPYEADGYRARIEQLNEHLGRVMRLDDRSLGTRSDATASQDGDVCDRR